MVKRRPDPTAAMRAWNASVKIGDPVYYRSSPGSPPQRFKTSADAQVLNGHTAVVWLEGMSACVAIAACKPLAAATLTIGIPQTELDKWAAAMPRVTVLRDFLEWCNEQKIELASYVTGIGDDRLAPVSEGREALLTRFVGVDAGKLDDERVALLNSIRKESSHG